MGIIKSIQLENFKSFGQLVNIPLAPITLIFGENSAGKTSILQSLYLLKQTFKDRNDALVPSIENAIIDLGSIEELILVLSRIVWTSTHTIRDRTLFFI